MKGITNIFVKNLKDIKPVNRPIHCSDKNKLEFYVRDKDKWKYDYNNIKLANSKLEAESNISIDLTDFSNGTHSLFAQYENSIESVFEVQYSDLEGGSFSCFACVEGNIAVGFNGIRKYIGTPFGPRFESGYSFNVPTQESYDAYNPADLRRDISILNIEKWVADWAELGVTITYGQGNEHTGYFNRKYISRTRDLKYS